MKSVYIPSSPARFSFRAEIPAAARPGICVAGRTFFEPISFLRSVKSAWETFDPCVTPATPSPAFLHCRAALQSPHHGGREAFVSAPIFDAEAAAAEVARALVSTQTIEGRAYVITPVTYPTGSHVTVRLDGMGDKWVVSDDGYGAHEAELMNALATFRRVAPQVAERAGVAFDQRALFVVEATRSELPGAVVVVANATAEAVRRTAATCRKH
jgi:hypothetical protein